MIKWGSNKVVFVKVKNIGTAIIYYFPIKSNQLIVNKINLSKF
jgi:hypothetical protein